MAVVKSGEQRHPGDAAPAPLAVASPPVTARPSLEADLARTQAERDALLLELGRMASPVAAPPPLLRAFRAMAEEENAYLDALDRILGPARAETLLNAKGFGRSTYSSSSR